MLGTGDHVSGAIVATLEEGILQIVLNRPEKRNAVNPEMYAALADLLAGAKSDEGVRAVMITARGPDFCAGTDISALQRGAASAPFWERPVGRFAFQLAWFDKPLAAAVRGRAIGFGFTLLLHCDLLYVAHNARLSAPFAPLGLCPEAGSSHLLPLIVGPHRALEVFARRRILDAAEAVDWGIATAALDPDELEALATRQVRAFAAEPLAALRATKRLVRRPQEIWRAMRREIDELTALLGDPEAVAALGQVPTKAAGP